MSVRSFEESWESLAHKPIFAERSGKGQRRCGGRRLMGLGRSATLGGLRRSLAVEGGSGEEFRTLRRFLEKRDAAMGLKVEEGS